jgi:hypothetical protein
MPDPTHCPRGPESDRVPPKKPQFWRACALLSDHGELPICAQLVPLLCRTLGSLLDRLGPMPDPTHCPRGPESDRVPPKKIHLWRAFALLSDPGELPICAYSVPPALAQLRGDPRQLAGPFRSHARSHTLPTRARKRPRTAKKTLLRRANALLSDPGELPICAQPVPLLWRSCGGALGSLLDRLGPMPDPTHWPRGPESDRVPPKKIQLWRAFALLSKSGELPMCAQPVPPALAQLRGGPRQLAGPFGSHAQSHALPTRARKRPCTAKKNTSGGRLPSCVTLGSCQSAPNQSVNLAGCPFRVRWAD